jgi:hypothetical protein
MTFNAPENTVDYECVNELCAWWIKETKFSEGMCALKKIAVDLVVKAREAK